MAWRATPAPAPVADLGQNRPMMMLIAALLRAARLLPAVLLVVGCAAGAGGPGWTFAPLGPTASPSPSPSASASGSPAGTVIELEATSSLRFAQDGQPIDQLELTIGEEYTFRVDNTAGFVHDIYLGPPERLAAGDTDGLPGIPEWESGVKEFTWTATAEAEGWEFACTVPGHYQAGMKGALVLNGGQ
jgi:hypothetical protein